MEINERFIWAVEVMDIHETDNILEIGCGAGILAEQIANKLTRGKMMAIDRSSAMIKMASKRNNRLIENGKAAFLTGDFVNTRFDEAQFDKILAFNVNVFWKNPVKELELIRKYLKSNGNLYIFYQAPDGINQQFIQKIKEPLPVNSFKIIDTVLKKLKPVSAICVITRPKQ